MQKRAKRSPHTGYPVEYAPFEEVFRRDPECLVVQYNQPDRCPIESIHHHDGVEVGFCESGSGVFFVDGENLPFSAPCVTVLYPGQLHKAYSTGTELSRWVFVTFRPEAVIHRDTLTASQMSFQNAAPEYALSGDPGLTILGAEIWRECAADQANRDDCLRGLLAAILIRHARLPRRQSEVWKNRMSALERLQPVLQYIDRHYAEELTIEQLAAHCFVHAATLREWFHAGVGVTPLRYVHRVRISVACSLLRGTGCPIAEVAQEVGYRSISGFNRHFLDVCGQSPSAYRQHRHMP